MNKTHNPNTEDHAIEELVHSFKKLLHNTSDDAETLNRLRVLLEDEKEKTLNSSKGSDTVVLFDDSLAANVIAAENCLEELVTHSVSYFSSEKLDELHVIHELEELYKTETSSKKYVVNKLKHAL